MMDLNPLDWDKVIRATGLVAEGMADRINGEYFSVYKSGAIVRIDIKCPSVSGPDWTPDPIDKGPYPTPAEILSSAPGSEASRIRRLREE